MKHCTLVKKISRSTKTTKNVADSLKTNFKKLTLMKYPTSFSVEGDTEMRKLFKTSFKMYARHSKCIPRKSFYIQI